MFQSHCLQLYCSVIFVLEGAVALGDREHNLECYSFRGKPYTHFFYYDVFAPRMCSIRLSGGSIKQYGGELVFPPLQPDQWICEDEWNYRFGSYDRMCYCGTNWCNDRSPSETFDKHPPFHLSPYQKLDSSRQLQCQERSWDGLKWIKHKEVKCGLTYICRVIIHRGRTMTEYGCFHKLTFSLLVNGSACVNYTETQSKQYKQVCGCNTHDNCHYLLTPQGITIQSQTDLSTKSIQMVEISTNAEGLKEETKERGPTTRQPPGSIPAANEKAKLTNTIDVQLQAGTEIETRTLKPLRFQSHHINMGFKLQSVNGSKKMVRLIPKRQLVMPLIFGSGLDRALEYIIENITIRLEPDPVLWKMLERFKYTKWPVEFQIVYSCSKCVKNPYAAIVVLVKIENQIKSNLVFQSKKRRVFFAPNQLIPYDRERYLYFQVPMDPLMQQGIKGKTAWFVMNQWLTIAKSDRETVSFAQLIPSVKFNQYYILARSAY